MPAKTFPIRPFRAVRGGDRVAVVAPSSPVRREMLDEGLEQVRRLGYEPVTRADVVARERFTAGSDARRLEELSSALADPTLRAIWIARGGYGLTPLLSQLDPEALRRDPKPILGESDATALGCWALCAGVAWLHGPMVASSLRLGAAGMDESSLTAALGGDGYPRTLVAAEARTLVEGRVEGTLWGGCLSMLAALCGTPWLPRVPGGVLVIEDTGVKPYQVHRMLVQLRDAGALEGLAGALLGDFSDCVQHPEQGYAMDDVFVDFFRAACGGIPVTAGWRVGHAAGPHWTLPLGVPAVLEADGDAPRLSWTLPPGGR